MKVSAVVVPLLASATAYAHGYLAALTVAGKNYQGDVPNGDPNPSVIRQVDDISPVKGAANPDLNCGLDAQLAKLVANANPGDQIDFDWEGGGDTRWPHNVGPMLTYMASCGGQTCDTYNSSQAKWFKIQQVSGSGTTWVQSQLMTGKPAMINLPSNLAPGNYLVRHEIIALHNAMALGGAEFYPACSQLTVGGSGNGKPKDNELVSLPGAYSDNDPGIKVNIYTDDAIANYQFPGPPIASFVIAGGGTGGGSGGGGGGGSTGDGGSGSGSGSNSGAGTVPPSSAGGLSASPSKCRLKRSNSGANLRRRSVSLSRHHHYLARISRVIKKLDAFGRIH